MKFKVYVVYYRGEKEKTFLRKNKAKKYIEYLQYYDDEWNLIYYRKEYVYV